jgi:hypothetical protein
MGLIARPVAGKKKSELICQAFIDGAPSHAHGEVFYGVDASNIKHWNRVLRARAPYYYCDNSYFDSVRGTQFRVTKNAMQVDTRKYQSDGCRFDALDLPIAPAQCNADGHWVLIEQSPWFMSLIGEPEWFSETGKWAAGTGRKVVARRWDADKLKIQATLSADLVGAWGLLTHSSAAAVTALLAGIPVRTDRAHAIAYVRVSSDNSVDGRQQAFGVLADHQFTLAEMKEGLAWAKVGS